MLSANMKLDEESFRHAFREVIDSAAVIGTPRILFSLGVGDPGAPQVMQALRATVAYAGDRGAMIWMETHPPSGTNSDIARQTLEQVADNGLRFHFDTANLHYYNHHIDT